jgi:hypothetical protein
MMKVSEETLKAATYLGLDAQEPWTVSFCPLLRCYELVEGTSIDWD